MRRAETLLLLVWSGPERHGKGFESLSLSRLPYDRFRPMLTHPRGTNRPEADISKRPLSANSGHQVSTETGAIHMMNAPMRENWGQMNI